jgi:hypothetical protein
LRLLGSTDTIAICLVGKSMINLLTSSSTKLDLPAPPVPVIPNTGVVAVFDLSLIACKTSLCFSGKFSAADRKRARALWVFEEYV